VEPEIRASAVYTEMRGSGVSGKILTQFDSGNRKIPRKSRRSGPAQRGALGVPHDRRPQPVPRRLLRPKRVETTFSQSEMTCGRVPPCCGWALRWWTARAHRLASAERQLRAADTVTQRKLVERIEDDSSGGNDNMNTLKNKLLILAATAGLAGFGMGCSSDAPAAEEGAAEEPTSGAEAAPAEGGEAAPAEGGEAAPAPEGGEAAGGEGSCGEGSCS